MPPHLLTIGHSNLPAERFLALLTSAGVTARSVPFSRWCPWFSAKALTERLVNESIAYIALGDALSAGRPGAGRTRTEAWSYPRGRFDRACGDGRPFAHACWRRLRLVF